MKQFIYTFFLGMVLLCGAPGVRAADTVGPTSLFLWLSYDDLADGGGTVTTPGDLYAIINGLDGTKYDSGGDPNDDADWDAMVIAGTVDDDEMPMRVKFTIPAIAVEPHALCVIGFFESATLAGPANTDLCEIGWLLFDPRMLAEGGPGTFTDILPLWRRKVPVFINAMPGD